MKKYEYVYQYNNFNDIISLDNYHEIKYIRCNNNQLTVLPQLPKSLEILDCFNNQLTTLPQLPNLLEKLICWKNQLTALPPFPNSLQYLDCDNNQLTALPQFPNSLQYFHCQNNLLKLKYIDNDNKYYHDKLIINEMQSNYLDSSYHPRNRFCKKKLQFSFDDLFDDDF